MGGQGFSWIYHACAQDMERPEKIQQSCMDGNAEWEIEGYFVTDWRRGGPPALGEEGTSGDEVTSAKKVELMYSVMSQEALLAHVDALAEEQILYHERVFSIIVGDANISQLVRVDTDMEHWLYMQQGKAVYALHGVMDEEDWQVFLDGCLGAGLCWGGTAVCESRSEMPVYTSEKEGGAEICEFWMRIGEKLPDYGTEAEYLSYFVQSYPTLSYYCVDLKNWKSGEEPDYDDVWRQAEDSEGKYVFFCYDSKPCAAGVTGEDFVGAVDKLQWQSPYGEPPSCFYWRREENGDIYCLEAMEGFREQLEQTVNGERLLITIEDINADGYLDLIIVNTFASANLNAGSYLWSPAEGRFLEDTGLLDFYSGYDVDTVNRRIHVYRHGSALVGSCTAYQWMDGSGFEKVKSYGYAGGYNDAVQVHISRYEDGEEEVWVDCTYTMEEFDSLEKALDRAMNGTAYGNRQS